ncbi:unnamed protein product [Rhizophagus irregularis]|uniref:Uncharacterized protein n=4 Tax=Rhizophagus irregularis TaxID=588596 RepID=A0A2N1P3B4_9GLOM|nr:hypothetical protein GLOIN_2v1771351 [Rhizophagus irregularis DAOM 181602=DAOM 197198]EXX68557.1 hypothetical protein RirG_104100 [Rhizophagus irregularis DAOM 197198w]PKK80631.1 hypothetical protein RhiirC2_767887 [Rhizophagus irregularis]POG74352.1 hypothetical protein GLOIN_2v1771351 [Rhizophagus irregularis DAOM 181602=DAOM 197198]CAB4385995.1 unnamed protein product [Rhizophagus irregularis]CAB5314746.1 unnamed protein product [Rhizophagus irregularis]|eukprot:XP_025181218.1 hypothetical protein GLOIN_2v1771351 [Rhizophagus irregularis DAOM 181602=DAOM 197198]
MGKPKANKNHSKSRTPNAWILFSNNHHNGKIRKHGSKNVKRTDSMKSAQIEWENMSSNKKLDFFLQGETIKERTQVEEANKYLDDNEKLTPITHDRFIIITPNYYKRLQKSKENRVKENKVFGEFIQEDAYI